MNSKIPFLFFLLLFAACGVKGLPVPPSNKPMPSVMENYPDIKDTDKKVDDVHKIR